MRLKGVGEQSRAYILEVTSAAPKVFRTARPRLRSKPIEMTKTALVIGCGGTIGGAWIVAALQALAEQTGTDPAEAAVLQGTSAGAEIVTMLGGGAGVTDLVAMHRGEATDPRLRRHIEDTPRGLPPVPRPRLLNPKLVRSESGLAAATGIAPTGRGDAAWLQRLADGFQQADGRLAHPDTRMVAYDFQHGERIAFGASGSPKATVAEALRASWAIPGWMPPVSIADRRYVDGGAAGSANKVASSRAWVDR